MMDKKRTLSSRHILVLSLALNIGLILRLGYVNESWRVEEHFDGFCVENQQNREAASMVDSPRKEAYFSKSTAEAMQVASSGAAIDADRVINLDHGDPTMYEKYWRQTGDKTTVVISGWQYLSYFSDITNVCWFLEPALAKAVIRLHKIVGNAVTDDRHIVVGTGSTQLFQAALYALCPPNASEPMSVVSAAPFYSSYPLMTDFLRSGLYEWAGDAHKFNKERPYIELVTSPNNPDGSTREAVINGHKGILVHDFAYYWPQYTPITAPADHDVMLFTVSKSTGHAGPRIGWALVKDREVAKKMTKFIELNTIGVSRDSQIRSAKILQAVADSSERAGDTGQVQPFFEQSFNLMEKRWNQLRAAVKKNELFSLPDFSSGFCNFSGKTFEPQPAFAWLKCEGGIEDCEGFLRKHRILTRGGNHFGFYPSYVRISMLAPDDMFHLFAERLSAIQP